VLAIRGEGSAGRWADRRAWAAAARAGQVINPGAVRQALAEHGIPALVTAGKFCYGDPAAAAAARQVYVNVMPTAGPSWPSATIVIHGSAIPSGDELSIGYCQGTQNGVRAREISSR
jgi:hypothetical protein